MHGQTTQAEVVATTEAEVQTGSNLSCYECKENYKNEHIYDPRQSPCRNNVTQVNVRQCTDEHKYCQVRDRTIFSSLETEPAGCVYSVEWNQGRLQRNQLSPNQGLRVCPERDEFK